MSAAPARPTLVHPRPARGVAALVAVAALAVLASAGAQSTRSAAAVVGFEDHAYSAAGPQNRATADKPQSKVWFTDGQWFGIQWVDSTTVPDVHRIRSLNTATHVWSNATAATSSADTEVDSRNNAHADALWHEGSQTLYVISTETTVAGGPGELRFARFGYDAATNAWTRQVAPLTVGTPGTETATIARDSTGQLWVTYPGSGADVGKVMIVTSTDGGTTWGTPFQLPTQSELANTAAAEDISAVISFSSSTGPAVAVVWNSTRTGEEGVFASIHDDDDDDATWGAQETAISGAESGDDHLNVKATSDGRLFVATKTGLDGNPNTGLPLGRLLMRSPTGEWSTHVFDTVADDGTRAQVAVAEDLGVVYVFLAQPVTGSTIHVKSASIDDLDAEAAGGDAAFQPGLGADFISNPPGDVNINDPSTSKQNPTAASGILVIASDRITKTYFHNLKTLPATDTTAPTPGTVAIDAGAAATNATAVTLTAPATDAGSGVAQVRLSNSPTLSGGVLASGTTFAFTTDPIAWSIAAGDGTKTVYAQWRDASGNWSSVASDTIVLDTVVPTITGAASPAANANGWRNTAVAVTFTCADALSGIASCGPNATLSTQGADQSVTGTAVDVAGNQAQTTVSNIDIDLTAPTSTGSLSPATPASGWHAGTVTVTLGGSDALSGLDRVEYRLDGGAWTTYSGPLAVTANGSHSVARRAVDKAGNVSAEASLAFKIDSTAPTGTVVIDGGAAKTLDTAVSVAAAGSDGAGSGMAQVRLSNSPTLSGGVLASGTTYAYTGAAIPWTLSGGDGTKTVYAQWRDAAGNWSAVASDTIVLDTSGPPPAGSIVIGAGSGYVKSLTTTLTLSKPADDVDRVRISNSSNVAAVAPRAYTGSPIAWTLLSGIDGTRTVYVQWLDADGNVSPVASKTVIVDRVAPTAGTPKPSLLAGTRQSSGVPVRLGWTGGDTGSPIARYEILGSRNGAAYKVLAKTTNRALTVNLGTGARWRIRIRAVDAAGNVRTGPASITFIPRAYQESSTAVRFSSGWKRGTSASYWGGAVRYTSTRSARATFTFTGRSVAFVAPKSPVRGQVKVYVDGRYVKTVSLYATSFQAKTVIYSRNWSTSARHTLTLVVVRTAGHPRVDVDGFIVLGG